MAIQYVSDDAGNPTAVLVPINDWNKLASMHDDVKALMQTPIKPVSKRKPSEFASTLDKELAKKMLSDIEKDRKEWERRF